MKDIEVLEEFIELDRKLRNNKVESDYDEFCERRCVAIENLLKENKAYKDKKTELEEYANWHIEHLTEDIADYIDDDRVGNANFIGELKEEREHWKDIHRIFKNEETYIDYKNY